jgi:6,7-dimethyl-8-ribityllumazine synthase
MPKNLRRGCSAFPRKPRNSFETAVLPPDQKIIILCSSYNENVTKLLLAGAQSALKKNAVSESGIEIHFVPGAFELSGAAYAAARRSDIAAVICLGAVIRGETPHFDFICQAAAFGITRASQDFCKPVVFGVITANTPEQAFERAGGKVGNKGEEAAAAAIAQIKTLNEIGG